MMGGFVWSNTAFFVLIFALTAAAMVLWESERAGRFLVEPLS